MADKFKIRHILDGSIITQDKFLQHLPYIIFLACLSILLIANNYATVRIAREANRISRELPELRTEHLATLSEYLRKKQQSEIARRLEDVGIRESVVPPKRIIINRRR
ncbi:MAG: FtsL-like putative cell division protein [Bacteroidales bacterium]|nr:FtsL-like putative cell division protein [Bacteroidales bacterium]